MLTQEKREKLQEGIPLKRLLANVEEKGADQKTMFPANVLPKPQFLYQLRMEKRRVERSGAPLSIALFPLSQGGKEGQGPVSGEFLNYLHKITRETDIKGWIDRETIGLILPDTGETGVKVCVEKILNINGNRSFSVITGTYPNQIFQKLLQQEESRSDPSLLDLDEVARPLKSRRSIKRGIDFVGALVGLMVLSPLMGLIALAVKVSSPGPVIFRQIRLGERGVRFPFYKFRSMYHNADEKIHRDFVTNLIKGRLEKVNQGEKEDPFYKIKGDFRVTPVGKVLRHLSLDELPQLFNVLKGEMSLVGPRPPIPYEVEKYEPWHRRRILEVKPGITGLWQVNGRSKTTFDDMVRLDLRYVKDWSLWLDLKILVQTIREIFRPQGAA